MVNRPKQTSKEYKLSEAEKALLIRLNTHMNEMNNTIYQILSSVAVEKMGFKEGQEVIFERVDLEDGILTVKPKD